MKKYILFILLVCATLQMAAQSPGYFGKKFIVGYSMYFNNAITNPTYNGNTGFFSINLQHMLSAEYITGRHISLGLNFRYFQTGFYYNADFNYSVPNTTVQARFDGREPYNGVGGPLEGGMRVMAIGFAPRFYYLRHIAPLGGYIRPELVLSIYNIVEAPESRMIKYCGHGYNAQASITPDIPNRSPYMLLGYGIEFGKSRVLFSRLLVDYGVRAGVTFGTGKIGDSYISENTLYKYLPAQRLFNSYLLNFKLGIGLLAF